MRLVPAISTIAWALTALDVAAVRFVQFEKATHGFKVSPFMGIEKLRKDFV